MDNAKQPQPRETLNAEQSLATAGKETRKVLILQVLRQAITVMGAIILFRLLDAGPFGVVGRVFPLIMWPRMVAVTSKTAAPTPTPAPTKLRRSCSRPSAIFTEGNSSFKTPPTMSVQKRRGRPKKPSPPPT